MAILLSRRDLRKSSSDRGLSSLRSFTTERSLLLRLDRRQGEAREGKSEADLRIFLRRREACSSGRTKAGESKSRKV